MLGLFRVALANACLGAGLLTCTAACNGSGAMTPCTDANVQLIKASNYDQSCKADSDCIGVAEGNACFPCVLQCPTASINRSAASSYQNDVSKTIGFNEGSNVTCNCPELFNPCCSGGVCHADGECSGGAQTSTAGRADGAPVDAAE